MSALREVVVTAVGVCSPLGGAAVAARRLREGASALVPSSVLAALPDDRAALVVGPDLRPWLKRRKDGKLLARPAELALAAAGEALAGFDGDRAALGLFLGVGREPPDSGESEACLAAAWRDGALDEGLLAGPGRDLYPPLLPLKTLPNMALAHVSINLGVLGENGSWAGGIGASWVALGSAWWIVAEGRAEAALAGGADSLTDLGSARDRLRVGALGPPGEAAAWLLLESAEHAARRGARALARLSPLSAEEAEAARDHGLVALRSQVGDLGAAEGATLLALAILAEEAGDFAGGEPGQAALGFRLQPGQPGV